MDALSLPLFLIAKLISFKILRKRRSTRSVSSEIIHVRIPNMNTKYDIQIYYK